jgi:hypothetical protein
MASGFEQNYSLMERLWDARISGAKARLLFALSEWISENEEFWVPVIVLTEFPVTDVVELVKDDILLYSDGESKVGFAHQTLFEFVRAKAILQNQTLVEFVLARQNSVFGRPTIWQLLKYVRSSAMNIYERDIQVLWHTDKLRFHVRVLLIEFWSQLPSPTAAEIRLMSRAVDDFDLSRRTLGAVAGHRIWWRILQDQIAERMKDPVTAFEVVPVLQGALEFDWDTVKKLIDEFWMPDPIFDLATLRVLEYSHAWTDSAVAMIERILRRTEPHGISLSDMLGRISEQNPHAAVDLVHAFLDLKLSQAQKIIADEESKSEELKEPEQSDDSIARRLFRSWDSKAKQQLRAIFSSTAISNMAEIADNSPKYFITIMWPWLKRALDLMLESNDFNVNRYRSDREFGSDFLNETYGVHRYSVLRAIHAAIIKFSQMSPLEYARFVSRESSSELLTLHRLLSRGLEANASSLTEQIFDYLIADPRRLAIGSLSDSHQESKLLIASAASHFSAAQLSALEAAILNWTYYGGAEGKDPSTVKLNWHHRIRLLRAIPEDAMSAPTRALLNERQTEFPNVSDEEIVIREVAWRGEVPEDLDEGEIASVLGLEGAERDAWLNRSESLRFSQKLNEMVADDPKQAINWIEQLEPSENQLPIAEALIELAKRPEVNPKRLKRLVSQLHERGFRTHEFGEAAGKCLLVLMQRAQLAITPTCLLIDRILQDVEFNNRRIIEYDRAEPGESVIWRIPTLYVDGPFALLEAAARLCLGGRRRDPERWVRTLDEYLTKAPNHQVWQALAITLLPHLRQTTREKSVRFLNRLFLGPTRLIETVHGCTLLAHVQTWVSTDVFDRWCQELRRSRWTFGAQGFGELATLHHIWFPENQWAAAETTAIMRDATGRHAAGPMSIGMASTLVEAWFQTSYRGNAAPYVLEMIDLNIPELGVVLAGIATNEKPLPHDQHTKALLQAIGRNPTILSNSDFFYIVDKMMPLLSFCADECMDLLETILKELGPDLADFRTEKPMIVDSLVSLSLTLQRQTADLRERALLIFEELMKLYVPQTFDILRDLDRQDGEGRLRRPGRWQRKKRTR